MNLKLQFIVSVSQFRITFFYQVYTIFNFQIFLKILVIQKMNISKNLCLFLRIEFIAIDKI